MSVHDLITNLIMDTRGFDDGAAHAQSMAHELHHELTSVAGEIAGAFGVGFGLDRGLEAIKGQIEQIVEMSHLSERTGIDTNDLLALQLEARKTGTDFEALQTGVKKLGVNIAESLGGSGDKLAYFKELGLDVHQLMDMNPAAQFTTVGEAVGRLENPTSRVHMAFELLGKSGAETLNVLTRGAEGLEDAKRQMGIVDEHDIQEMERAHEAMIDMDVAGQKLARTFAADLAPGISKAVDGLNWLIKAGGEEFLFLKSLDELDHKAQHDWVWGEGSKGIDNVDDFLKQHKAAEEQAHNGHKPSPEELAAQEAAQRREQDAADAEDMKQMDEAQRIREQNDPAEKYKREVGDLTSNPFLDQDDFALALTDAAKRFTDEMERRDPFKKMEDEAKRLFDQARTPDSLDVEFRLRRGNVIEGTVRNARTGELIVSRLFRADGSCDEVVTKS